MKQEIKKRLPITIAIITFSIATIVFATLSILNPENWMFRILTQANLCLMFLLNGTNNLVYQKQKAIGFLLLGVSALLLCVMIYTIYVGHQKSAF